MHSMFFLCAFVILPLLTSAYGGGGGGGPAEVPWRSAREWSEVPPGDTQTLPPPFLNLPVFVDSRRPLVEMERFSPVRGSGQERLPQAVRQLLIPAGIPSDPPPGASGAPVRTRCQENKMHVQVERGLLGPREEAEQQLRLGSCRANNRTKEFLQFDYDFDMCGTKRTIIDNQVTYSNTLRYAPPKLQEPIRRAVPFSLSVSCYYNRYQYSYKIGYKPKMQIRKIFKSMKNRSKFILTPRNAQWERLSPSDQYVLGKPMYFEAVAPSMSPDKRLYVHSCHVTADKSHTSSLQFPVVKNFGCMVESRHSRSRFIPYKNNAVRFTVDAFVFKGLTDQQLYMHCNASVGSSEPSPTAKSCNYDTKAGIWVELYGSDSVCACCDSYCSSATATETKAISSKPWRIEPERKITTAVKRGNVSITTTTTASSTTAAAPQPETSTELRERSSTAARTLIPKVEDRVELQQWPFGEGGVSWVEREGEEKKVKGSAVVEEEVEEEEEEEEEGGGEEVVEKVVTRPRLIFEEVFGFIK